MSRTISRRTLLHGAGVAMSLPWMQSLPVWGGESTASPLPKRFARCSWLAA